MDITPGVKQFASQETLGKIEEKFKQLYDYAIKSETHLWIATGAYHLSDETLRNMENNPLLLDLENLLMEPQIGCYVCEEPFQMRLLTRKCKGEPR